MIRRKNVPEKWKFLGGYVRTCPKDEEGQKKTVRLRIEPDLCYSPEDLFGDIFNPPCNHKIAEATLEQQRKENTDRVENEGMWGIIGEVWNGEEWVEVDACWGFIGDAWKMSGYDLDIQQTTIDKYHARRFCPTCGRPRKS